MEKHEYKMKRGKILGLVLAFALVLVLLASSVYSYNVHVLGEKKEVEKSGFSKFVEGITNSISNLNNKILGYVIRDDLASTFMPMQFLLPNRGIELTLPQEVNTPIEIIMSGDNQATFSYEEIDLNGLMGTQSMVENTASSAGDLANNNFVPSSSTLYDPTTGNPLPPLDNSNTNGNGAG